jgi:hypothetical protein
VPADDAPLQALVEEWLAAHPGESYGTVAQRAGIPRSTMHYIVTNVTRRALTLERLESVARGLRLPLGVVLAAAGVPIPTSEIAAATRVLRVERAGETRAQVVFAGEDGSATSIELPAEVAAELLVQLAHFLGR